MKNLKNTLLAGTATIGLLISSPQIYAKDLDFGFRFGFSPRKYSLNLNESKSIPVHPDDAHFLYGETEVKAGDDGVGPCGIDFGGEIRKTWENGLSIFGGLEYELELTSPDYGTSEMYTMVQQSSDTRPAQVGSFVYDRVDPEGCNLMPFLGIGIKGDYCFADFEYSFTTRSFKREWGHHRYGREEAVGSEKYNSSGNRLVLKVGPTSKLLNMPEDGLLCGLKFILEDYNLEKSGENVGKLKSYAIGFFVKKEF